MKLDDAKEERSRIIDHYFEMRDLDPRERVTTLAVAPRPDLHLGVGYIRRSERRYGLEVRIRKDDGIAASYAASLREKYGGDVSVSRIGRVEVPSRARILRAEQAIVFPDRRRPLVLGASVAHRDAMAGSIGLFAEWREGALAGRKGIVSNSHVLALAGRGMRGDPVYQPGRPDAKPLLAELQIATLSNFTVLSPAGTQELDAAVACLADETLVGEGNVIPAGLAGGGQGGRRLQGVAECETLGPHPRVCKVGRSTGLTTATITAIGLDNLSIYVPDLRRNIRFDNVFEITWDSPDDVFAGPGDSGSVVYDPATMNAVGLVFAGSLRDVDGTTVGTSYACGLVGVLKAFGLSMLS